jgi:hypothetical protein
MHQKTLEDTRRHGTEVEDQQLPGGASWPNHHAAQPPMEFFNALLEYFSTVS